MDDFAGGGFGDEDLGVAFAAGALVEEAVFVEEAFGVVLGGVRVFGDDFVGVDGGGGEGGRGSEGEEERGELEAGHVDFTLTSRSLGKAKANAKGVRETQRIPLE